MADGSKSVYLTGKMEKMTYLPFGQYKDWDIEDVPSKYLEWFLENIDPETDNLADICRDIRDELIYRDCTLLP